MKSRRSIQVTLPGYLIRSVLYHIEKKIHNCATAIRARHAKKLSALSKSQSKPLSRIKDTIKMLDNVKIPDTIAAFLAFCPKYPVRDEFNELQFLADVDSLLHNLKQENAPHEKLDEVNPLALWYCKRMKQQREDPMLKKMKNYMNKNNIKTVPFDQGMGFCLMSQETYWRKLSDIQSDKQFAKVEIIGPKTPPTQ